LLLCQTRFKKVLERFTSAVRRMKQPKLRLQLKWKLRLLLLLRNRLKKLPPLLSLKRLRKIPQLNNQRRRSATRESIAEEVMASGVETAQIVVIAKVVAAELQERMMMGSQLKPARNQSQEAEEATAATEAIVEREAKEAMKEVSIGDPVMEQEVASAQERREQLSLLRFRISNEKFERRFGI
jgi:hypothetical protein